MQQKLQLPEVLLEAPSQSSFAIIERLSCRISWYFVLCKLLRHTVGFVFVLPHQFWRLVCWKTWEFCCDVKTLPVAILLCFGFPISALEQISLPAATWLDFTFLLNTEKSQGTHTYFCITTTMTAVILPTTNLPWSKFLPCLSFLRIRVICKQHSPSWHNLTRNRFTSLTTYKPATRQEDSTAKAERLFLQST